MADDKPLDAGTADVPPGASPPGGKTEGIAPGAPPKSTAPPGAVTAGPMAVPPIPLNPTAKPAKAPATPAKKEPEPPKDTFRDLVETIVFVVVLVLMLKTFLAEAFVIPTGSMADTLLGYHHKRFCEQCGYPNLVNASYEADPQGREPEIVVSYQCENCGATNKLGNFVGLPEGQR